MNSFEIGAIIRNRRDGTPRLVIGIMPRSVLVIDPTLRGSPIETQAILERDWDYWVRDIDEKCIKVRVLESLDYEISFKYSPVK